MSAKSGDPLTLEGVTSGYRHIVNLVRHRLGLTTPVREQVPRHSFVFSEKSWLLVILIVALLAGIALVAAGKVHPLYGVLIQSPRRWIRRRLFSRLCSGSSLLWSLWRSCWVQR